MPYLVFFEQIFYIKQLKTKLQFSPFWKKPSEALEKKTFIANRQWLTTHMTKRVLEKASLKLKYVLPPFRQSYGRQLHLLE